MTGINIRNRGAGFPDGGLFISYHHTVPHHTLEFDAKLSVLGKGEKPVLDGNLIIEGDNLLALKALARS